MSSLKTLNPKAEIMNRTAALFMTINAAKGLLDVMRTNLGPRGTVKMLVGGAGGQCLSQSLHTATCNITHQHVCTATDCFPNCRHQADQGWQRALA